MKWNPFKKDKEPAPSPEEMEAYDEWVQAYADEMITSLGFEQAYQEARFVVGQVEMARQIGERLGADEGKVRQHIVDIFADAHGQRPGLTLVGIYAAAVVVARYHDEDYTPPNEQGLDTDGLGFGNYL